MLILTIVIVAVNALFVERTVRIALRSNAAIGASEPPATLPSLSIVVPARNEERQIEDCVRSLLAQDYPDFEVIVVDDRSDDATPEILERVAASDRRLRVVPGKQLPAGWIGKPWAIEQGVAVSRGAWLLFTDADTIHEPAAAAAAVSYALRERLAALSLLTDQIVVTLAERAILPSILWTIAFGTGPLDDVNDPSQTEKALFNGQYLLVERSANDAIGGHASVRGEIAEDLELARRFKRDGRFRTALAGANALVRTRMYRSFPEIWDGFVKNFALGLRGQPVTAGLGITFFAILSPVAPLALIVAVAKRDAVASFSIASSMIAAPAAAEFAMRRMRLPRWSGLWLHAGVATMVAIFATSIAKHARGDVRWRGRTYRSSPGSGGATEA